MRYKAFIFDLNGTIIDDMPFHTRAWHRILNEELGARLTAEEVSKEMYGKNEEVLDRIFGAGRFSDGEKKAISVRKEQQYQAAFLPHLQLINGLDPFLAKADERGIAMAIGTAAIPFNVDFVVDQLSVRKYFKAIITANDVTLSKPHPETFLKCAEALGIPPSECLVFEDVPKGAAAAQNAGMDTVIVTTGHQPAAFTHLNRILFYIRDFTDPVLNTLLD
ncbi:haloacid dehalogenase [Niabella ginsenosidivorans]|uniref:Haloacid dehalogenase n=1 Tax=Niabella ginsenosidivorans TaxID=1176587 RepID=A0A1A9IA00_9BACT|nr:HAD family phosphatase [Niabella ginsenosidivorans]ANH83879.1 haloacid dehalogenase [Niabella ginsenosidivorans]